MEPCTRLHQNQSRVQALLCGTILRAIPRCEGASLRARVRFAACSSEAWGAITVERATYDFRQFDERLVSGRRAASIYLAGGRHDAACALAYHQVLTKRSERMRELLSGALREAAGDDHIWWGVSVEDRKYGLPRIANLQETPAAVRFLSVEPLLEDLGKISLQGISWVIVGGESGPGARPMKESWVLSIREQCTAAGVPFFFKQWGGVRKKAAGRMLRGRTYDGFPRRPENPVLPTRLRLQHALEIEGGLVQLAIA